MESNQTHFAEQVAQAIETLNRMEEHVGDFEQVVTRAITALFDSHAKLAEELSDLRNTVDRYIRFRGNGSEQN